MSETLPSPSEWPELAEFLRQSAANTRPAAQDDIGRLRARMQPSDRPCCDECTRDGRTNRFAQVRFHLDRANRCAAEARTPAENAARMAHEAAAVGRKVQRLGIGAIVLAVIAVAVAFL